jgi:hypothetical protein
MAPLLHSKRAPEKVNILAQGELPRHILNHLTIYQGMSDKRGDSISISKDAQNIMVFTRVSASI